jgi:protein-S-isoprenylcysteine O-methyltransferase Ste14
MTDVVRSAWLSLAVFIAVLGLLLLAAAGTLHYWQAWTYLAVLGTATALITLRLIRHDRALLERRMRGGPAAENNPVQRLIMACASLAFLAMLLLPALDVRFGWSQLPVAWVAVGDVLVVAGLWLVHRVYRENSFASATIEISSGQRVIATGPYAIVRHPMYASASLFLLGTPLALGSCWGLLALLLMLMLPSLAWRLLHEEHFLMEHLPGYGEYRQRVRYRLLPFIW